MIYRMGIISRRDGVSEDEFRRHWIEIHGSLAQKLAGLDSYRQNHIRERIFEARPSPLQQIDGFSQLRFASIAAMEKAEASPGYAAVKRDIPTFQGAITILVLARQDIPVAAPGALNAKLMWISRLRQDREERNWDVARAEWLGGMLRDVPGVTGAAQNLVVDKEHPVSAGVPQGAPAADAVTEVWFRDQDALAEAVSRGDADFLRRDPLLDALGVYRVEERTIV